MAISATFYFIIRTMFENGLLPQGGALLELGEANWYGQVTQQALTDDIRQFVADPQRRDQLLARLVDVEARQPSSLLFDIAKVFYHLYFNPQNLQAVDYGGTESALRQDLNWPLELDRKFNVVFNHGTAEHIFNIPHVFKTVHDYTLPGGLMIHESPFTGWIDHGFYSLHPTLFFDLAETNRYLVMGMFIEDLTTMQVQQIADRDAVAQLVRAGDLPPNSMLLTILRQAADEQPFRVPLQGVYRGTLSEAGMSAWRELR
jgi:hypothetical protein